MEGVMFGNNVVKNGRIHQEIKWTALVLRHNAKPQYTIRYANDSSKVLSDGKFKFSSEPNTTLQLTFGSSNITYYAVVAVRQTGEQERGDFSDPVSIAYTSEFIAYEDNHRIHDRHSHLLVLQYRSWSTSRPDTCQQNLSQHHIPVVPTW